MRQPQTLSIAVDEKRRVSGLLQVPGAARVCCVLAHGAGAGMSHPFMAAVADGLAQHGVAPLRYQFPYMEEGSKRPDTAKVAEATVRAAVGEALRLLPGVAVVARISLQVRCFVMNWPAGLCRNRPILKIACPTGLHRRGTSAPRQHIFSRTRIKIYAEISDIRS